MESVTVHAKVTAQDISLAAARDGMSITEQEAMDWLERNRAEIEAAMIRTARSKIDELMKDDPPETAFHQMLGLLYDVFERTVEKFARKNRSSAIESCNSVDDFYEIARDFASGKRTEAASVIGITLEKGLTQKNYRCRFQLHKGKIVTEIEPQSKERAN